MGGPHNPGIAIPSVMVSQADGTLFMANAPFNATISDGTGGVPRPRLRPRRRCDRARVRPRHLQPPHRRPATVSCLEQRRADGRRLERLRSRSTLTTQSVRHGRPRARGIGTYVSFQPHTATASGRRRTRPTWRQPVDLRLRCRRGQHQPAARHRLRLEHDAVGGVLEPRRPLRLQPDIYGTGRRAGTTSRCSS